MWPAGGRRASSIAYGDVWGRQDGSVIGLASREERGVGADGDASGPGQPDPASAAGPETPATAGAAVPGVPSPEQPRAADAATPDPATPADPGPPGSSS